MMTTIALNYLVPHPHESATHQNQSAFYMPAILSSTCQRLLCFFYVKYLVHLMIKRLRWDQGFFIDTPHFLSASKLEITLKTCSFVAGQQHHDSTKEQRSYILLSYEFDYT